MRDVDGVLDPADPLRLVERDAVLGDGDLRRQEPVAAAEAAGAVIILGFVQDRTKNSRPVAFQLRGERLHVRNEGAVLAGDD